MRAWPPYNRRRRMRPHHRHLASIDAPRERVFDYLSDIANHAEFSDHYLQDFRLERLSPGASAPSAQLPARLPARHAVGETVLITELEAPHRIVLEGSAGPHRADPDASRVPPHAGRSRMTRVEYRSRAEPAHAASTG